MVSNVASNWPYAGERRALNWPIHGGILANCITSTMIVPNAFMFNPKMSLLESIRTCPRSPFAFGVYTSGISFYMMRQHAAVVPDVFSEHKPCSSCVLSKNVAIALSTGLVLPLLTTPYLCHY
ncbi:hypothetical protein COOONC_01788, partial [Cooperia oncophora]